jgi:hypothetical protein
MNTKTSFVTKDQFVALLRESGITEAQMTSLHRTFEARHPDGHEAFLRALQLDDATVTAIRTKSRS